MFVYSLSVHIVRVYRRTLKRAKEVKSHHHRERPREVQPAREIPCLLPWEGKRIRAITATQVISESFGRRGSPWPSLALRGSPLAPSAGSPPPEKGRADGETLGGVSTGQCFWRVGGLSLTDLVGERGFMFVLRESGLYYSF